MRNEAERLSTFSREELRIWSFKTLTPEYGVKYDATYPIRGHHIKFYARLAGSWSPRELTEWMVNSSLSQEKSLYPKQYFEDVIGNDPRHAFIYETRLQASFLRYDNMHKDSSVSIVPYEDEICGVCTHGTHCEVSKFEARHESEFVAGFAGVLDLLNLGNEYSLDVERMDFPENTFFPYKARLETTKEVADFGLQSIFNVGSTPFDYLEWNTLESESLSLFNKTSWLTQFGIRRCK